MLAPAVWRLGLVLVLAAGCSHAPKSPAAQAPVSPPPDNPAYCSNIPLGRSFCEALELDAPKGKLRLAVAANEDARERGLMGVRNVPPGEGMMFVFPDASNSQRQFWMKDTVVPLDMIFVSSGGVVMEVASNVAASKPGAPESTVARREGVGRYVIELRAGGADAAGIEPGTRFIVPPIFSQ